MRSPARALAPALTAALLLAACGDPPASTPRTGPPPVTLTAPATSTNPPPTTTPDPPTVPGLPADVPTTGPNLTRAGETPPLMPPEATAHTPAGAVAFAEFFIRTMDWGYATVSSTYMRHYFTADCTICAGLADGIDGIAAKGRHVYGNRFAIAPGSTATPGSSGGEEYAVRVSYSVTSGEVVDTSGRFVEGQPALQLVDQISTRWSHDRWSVVAIGFVQ
ncbi:MAG: hypothetical protein EPN43_14415 [Jatrophihabitans sp.]|nr:MAG: hypothetical protein EPN43_14415 [Jatrophihabitans sp.]